MFSNHKSNCLKYLSVGFGFIASALSFALPLSFGGLEPGSSRTFYVVCEIVDHNHKEDDGEYSVKGFEIGKLVEELGDPMCEFDVIKYAYTPLRSKYQHEKLSTNGTLEGHVMVHKKNGALKLVSGTHALGYYINFLRPVIDWEEGDKKEYWVKPSSFGSKGEMGYDITDKMSVGLTHAASPGHENDVFINWQHKSPVGYMHTKYIATWVRQLVRAKEGSLISDNWYKHGCLLFRSMPRVDEYTPGPQLFLGGTYHLDDVVSVMPGLSLTRKYEKEHQHSGARASAQAQTLYSYLPGTKEAGQEKHKSAFRYNTDLYIISAELIPQLTRGDAGSLDSLGIPRRTQERLLKTLASNREIRSEGVDRSADAPAVNLPQPTPEVLAHHDVLRGNGVAPENQPEASATSNAPAAPPLPPALPGSNSRNSNPAPAAGANAGDHRSAAARNHLVPANHLPSNLLSEIRQRILQERAGLTPAAQREYNPLPPQPLTPREALLQQITAGVVLRHVEEREGNSSTNHQAQLDGTRDDHNEEGEGS